MLRFFWHEMELTSYGWNRGLFWKGYLQRCGLGQRSQRRAAVGSSTMSRTEGGRGQNRLPDLSENGAVQWEFCSYGETWLLKGCETGREWWRHSPAFLSTFWTLVGAFHWPISTGSQKARESGWCCLLRLVPQDIRKVHGVKNKWWVGTESNFTKENYQHYSYSVEQRNTRAGVTPSRSAAKSIPNWKGHSLLYSHLWFSCIVGLSYLELADVERGDEKGWQYQSILLYKGHEHPWILVSPGVWNQSPVET